MANVIDDETVAIAPVRHVKVVRRSPIVMPERLVEEEIAGAAIVGQTEAVADDQKTEGLPQSGLPVEFIGRSWSRLKRFNGQQIEFGSRDRKSRRGNGEARGNKADLGGRGTGIDRQKKRVLVRIVGKYRSCKERGGIGKEI